MARDYDVSALGLALWQGLPLDSAGRWKEAWLMKSQAFLSTPSIQDGGQPKNRGQDSDSDLHLGGSCIPLSRLG